MWPENPLRPMNKKSQYFDLCQRYPDKSQLDMLSIYFFLAVKRVPLTEKKDWIGLEVERRIASTPTPKPPPFLVISGSDKISKNRKSEGLFG